MVIGLVEPKEINQEDSDITQSDTTAATLTDLFVYRVPRGRTLILREGDPFSMPLKTTGGAACADTTKVRLEARDSANQGEKRPITGDILYASIKEFQDVKLMYTLPKGMVLNEKEYLAVMVNDSVGADKDDSWFSLVAREQR